MYEDIQRIYFKEDSLKNKSVKVLVTVHDWRRMELEPSGMAEAIYTVDV